MRNGVNVVLLSPRRYGKTSLLLRAEAQLVAGRPEAAVVNANVLRCRDLSSLVSRLVSGVYRVPGARWHRARQAVPQFVRRLRLAPSVTFDDSGAPRFSFLPGLAATDAEEVIADVYQLLAEQAPRRPAALVLDEFQAIVDHGVHLPGLFKALADEHPEVALVLAGSKRHLMERLVTSSGAPLYDMAERLELGPIPPEVMVDYLRRRAEAGRKSLAEGAAREIVQMAGPVPNDIQRLAYEAYDAASGAIDATAVGRATSAAVAHGAAGYAEQFGRMAAGQRRVVTALASEPSSTPYAAAFVSRVNLANGASVRKALVALAETEVVVERDGFYAVADPFFAAWLRPEEESDSRW